MKQSLSKQYKTSVKPRAGSLKDKQGWQNFNKRKREDSNKIRNEK